MVDLAVGGLALHYAEENPDGVVAALDDRTEEMWNHLVLEQVKKHARDNRPKTNSRTVYAGETSPLQPTVSTASSMSLTSQFEQPAISSLVSVKGPSRTHKPLIYRS